MDLLADTGAQRLVLKQPIGPFQTKRLEFRVPRAPDPIHGLLEDRWIWEWDHSFMFTLGCPYPLLGHDLRGQNGSPNPFQTGGSAGPRWEGPIHILTLALEVESHRLEPLSPFLRYELRPTRQDWPNIGPDTWLGSEIVN